MKQEIYKAMLLVAEYGTLSCANTTRTNTFELMAQMSVLRSTYILSVKLDE